MRSPRNAAKEGHDITEIFERVLAQFNLSMSKKSFNLANDDVLSTRTTQHNIFASHIQKNSCYSLYYMMVMQAMMTNASPTKKKLVILTKAIEVLLNMWKIKILK